MEFLEGLNKEQLEAVNIKNGAILVLAGAGSGKTKVLTSRIANLIHGGAGEQARISQFEDCQGALRQKSETGSQTENDCDTVQEWDIEPNRPQVRGVSPFEILAVTFTNKASKEMRSRLSKYLGEETVKRMWVGTFHNICGRILRAHLGEYQTKDGRKWDNNYVIYDDTDTKTVIKNAIKKLNLDEKIYELKLVKAVISNAKNKMQDAHAFATTARDYKTEKISEIYYEYEKQLCINNAIDFDDMLLLCVNLLENNDAVRNHYAERFKHILVDEFQDTNKAQYKFVRMLFNDVKAGCGTASLLAVGDVDQSIYSWRGADFKIILGFQKDYAGTKLIKLEQNYRSTKNILDAANAVIINNDDRIDKVLYSQKGDGSKIQLFEAENDLDEASYIAKKIRKLSEGGKDGAALEDMAVLYRTNAQSRSIEEALMSNSIPYKIVGGLKFYDRKEIKDILAYLKLIYNQNDAQSLRRIINVPKRALGETTVKKIADIADENGISMFEVIQNIEEYEGFSSKKAALAQFADMIRDFSRQSTAMTLSEFTALVLENSGYLSELRLEDTVENQSRLENLQEFINVVREFELDEFNFEQEEDGEELGPQNPLGTFLSQVALVSDIDSLQEEEKSVTLMTLHAAKGLEFPIVFLAGLEEGIFPHSRSISYTAKSDDLEEERRLMYVGITRAKDVLHLTYAKQRRVWGDIKMFPPSRFIEEIPNNLLQTETESGFEGVNGSGTIGGRTSGIRKVIESRGNTARDAGRTGDSFKNAGNTGNAAGNSLASSLARIKKAANTGEGNGHSNSKTVKEHFGKDFKKPVIQKTTAILSESGKPPPKQTKTPSVADLIAKCKAQAQAPASASSTPKIGHFAVNTRVFHPHFGIGHIKEVVKNASGHPVEYIVDFSKVGIKSIDFAMNTLKVF